jgi:hypothetical protein
LLSQEKKLEKKKPPIRYLNKRGISQSPTARSSCRQNHDRFSIFRGFFFSCAAALALPGSACVVAAVDDTGAFFGKLSGLILTFWELGGLGFV